MTDLYERVKWHHGMTRRDEDLYFSRFFRDAEEHKRKEDIKIGIAENDTLRQVFGAVTKLVTGKDNKIKTEPMPWLPEYDNLILSFWTPKELKAFASSGFTKEQLVRHTKNYLVENAWEMDHWKSKTKEEYQEEIRHDPAYHLVEIVYFKDSKRGIPLEEWGYTDLIEAKKQKINREELLGIKAARPTDATEQAVLNEFKQEKTAPVQGYTVDGMLLDSVSGRRALNVLGRNDYAVDFAPMTFVDSMLFPKERKLTLNQNFSGEVNALSVIKASCRIKHRRDGAEPTPQMNMDTYIAANAVCQADILASQLVYAEEMRNKNPEILRAFKAEGNKDLCEKFEETLTKTKNLDTARSAVVDSYLEKTLPMTESKRLEIIQNWKKTMGAHTESRSSKELFGKTCKDFDGKSYYNGGKATDEPLKVRATNGKDALLKTDGSYKAFMAVLKSKGGR